MRRKREEIDPEIARARIMRDSCLMLQKLEETAPELRSQAVELRRLLTLALNEMGWFFAADKAKEDESFLLFPRKHRVQILKIEPEKNIIARNEFSGNDIEIFPESLLAVSEDQTLIVSAKSRKKKQARASHRAAALEAKREQKKEQEDDPTLQMLKGELDELEGEEIAAEATDGAT